MNNFYQIKNLPSLDKFNEIKINYINPNNINSIQSTQLINNNNDLNIDLISLITSLFEIKPLIYGNIEYCYLDKVFNLKIPYNNCDIDNIELFDKLKQNTQYLQYLNHNLNDNKNYFLDNENTLNQFRQLDSYQIQMSNFSIDEYKFITFFQKTHNKNVNILKSYHNINKTTLFEWKILPYMSLFISINLNNVKQLNKNNSFNNQCQIYFVINKLESNSLIKEHSNAINDIITKFDKVFKLYYNNYFTN